jgi:hypothetical protein
MGLFGGVVLGNGGTATGDFGAVYAIADTTISSITLNGYTDTSNVITNATIAAGTGFPIGFTAITVGTGSLVVYKTGQ